MRRCTRGRLAVHARFAGVRWVVSCRGSRRGRKRRRRSGIENGFIVNNSCAVDELIARSRRRIIGCLLWEQIWVACLGTNKYSNGLLPSISVGRDWQRTTQLGRTGGETLLHYHHRHHHHAEGRSVSAVSIGSIKHHNNDRYFNRTRARKANSSAARACTQMCTSMVDRPSWGQ